MYDLSTQKVYIHIPKHNMSPYLDLHERQMTQGEYMYILKFDKIDIYMKTHNHENKTKMGIQV